MKDVAEYRGREKKGLPINFTHPDSGANVPPIAVSALKWTKRNAGAILPNV